MFFQDLIGNFKEILTKKYVCFSGRAGRKEYWLWVLFVVVVSVVLSFIPKIGAPLGTLWSLAVLLPGLAVAIRRLHDTDRSGWMILLNLIPFIGWLIVLIFLVQEGTQGSNRFGEPENAPAPAPAEASEE